jgi:hypothetical protein
VTIDLSKLALKPGSPPVHLWRDPNPVPFPRKTTPVTRKAPAFVISTKSYSDDDLVRDEMGLRQVYASAVILVFDHEGNGKYVFRFVKNRHASDFVETEYYERLRSTITGNLTFYPTSAEYEFGSLVMDVVAFIDMRAKYP